MIALVTILVALPIGMLVRSRLVASLTYAVAYLWAFVFQTLYLLLDSLGERSAAAFTPGVFPLSYGGVTLAVVASGLLLVRVGHAVRRRIAPHHADRATAAAGVGTER
ncbi:MAG TPA: hypothetical protein VFP34_14390 [Microlunatus sp.]|nr:hypothetical protein [Microlunatus sp.]